MSKRYTHEFQIEAVEPTTERGYSAYEVAERLGISINSNYNWQKQLLLQKKKQVTVTLYSLFHYF